MKFIRNPVASAELIEKPAPYLGQHTREILKELDFDNSLIEELAG
jgi:crotonobetainyl-CoA:carnitine CoA-transferase CaiB-like acyl-CoA transferase